MLRNEFDKSPNRRRSIGTGVSRRAAALEKDTPAGYLRRPQAAKYIGVKEDTLSGSVKRNDRYNRQVPYPKPDPESPEVSNGVGGVAYLWKISDLDEFNQKVQEMNEARNEALSVLKEFRVVLQAVANSRL